MIVEDQQSIVNGYLYRLSTFSEIEVVATLANLIGAEISINSELNKGTHMHVLWKSKEPI